MKENKKIGTVTDEEKDQIEKIFERKNSLQELLLTLQTSSLVNKETKDTIYEKLVNDIDQANRAYDKWWSDMQRQYGWLAIVGYNYKIDFNTKEVVLEKTEASPDFCEK